LGYNDQDVQLKTDGYYIYVLERGMGAITKYSLAGLKAGHKIWQYSVGADSSPHDIVFAHGKAYVIRYCADSIWVINPDAADQTSFKIGEIDISGFDTNGPPEAAMGVTYDGMLYVLLQKQDNYTTVTQGLLLKIDTATDEIVDLDSGTDGVQGLELLVKNPQWATLLGSTYYIAGKDWNTLTEGIMTVDLSDPTLPQSLLLSEEDAGMPLTGLEVFNDTTGIIYSAYFDKDWNYHTIAYIFNPGDGTVGEPLPVPSPLETDITGMAVMVGNYLYVGSRDDSAPGIYVVDPSTNTLVDTVITSGALPPISLIYLEDTTGISKSDTVPGAFAAVVAYPNPFNQNTTINFTLRQAHVVTIDCFNTAGQKIDTIINSFLNAGNFSVLWNAVDRSSGVYYIRITDGTSDQIAKVTLVK
ncbi:MAG TPA: T9SS type A sorting domain-containing protein, partial [Anaerolineae bacterium]|nr:T9SS type A sorting domain-containing protein [Anaerolineae bacterium]